MGLYPKTSVIPIYFYHRQKWYLQGQILVIFDSLYLIIFGARVLGAGVPGADAAVLTKPVERAASAIARDLNVTIKDGDVW